MALTELRRSQLRIDSTCFASRLLLIMANEGVAFHSMVLSHRPPTPVDNCYAKIGPARPGRIELYFP